VRLRQNRDGAFDIVLLAYVLLVICSLYYLPENPVYPCHSVFKLLKFYKHRVFRKAPATSLVIPRRVFFHGRPERRGVKVDINKAGRIRL
jgi:hypothetical protein